MDHARVVRGPERERHLAPHLQRLAQRERRVALPGLEVFAVEPLHGDVGRADLQPAAEPVRAGHLERAEGDHPHDAGVIQVREHLPLALEAGLVRGVGAGGRDDLEGHALPGERVLGAVHDPGGPSADLSLDAKALGDEPSVGASDRVHHLRPKVRGRIVTMGEVTPDDRWGPGLMTGMTRHPLPEPPPPPPSRALMRPGVAGA